MEPGSGAKALKLDTAWFEHHWSKSLPFGVSFVPWVKLTQSDPVAPKEFLRLNFTLSPDISFAWLYFYAKKSLGTWHPRRNVRLVQRTFRYAWVLSGWDGGLHSGACAKGFVRYRTRRCVGSDGMDYDESHCVGGCLDITTEQNFDYPVRKAWKDGYNNRCEDYHTLSFCNTTGYGPNWQSWWGRFEDWVSSGPGAGEACCLCGGGVFETPVLSEDCPSVNCPANSFGHNVLQGCSCHAGYQGQVRPSEQYPYYTGLCFPVACPEHSMGQHVADGCVCEDGYIGSIIPSKEEPFFTGICEVASTTASSGNRTAISTKTTTSTTSGASLESTRFARSTTYSSVRNGNLTTLMPTTSTSMSTRTMVIGTFPERRSVQVSTVTSTSKTLRTIDFWESTSFTSTSSFPTSSKSSQSSTYKDPTATTTSQSLGSSSRKSSTRTADTSTSSTSTAASPTTSPDLELTNPSTRWQTSTDTLHSKTSTDSSRSSTVPTSTSNEMAMEEMEAMELANDETNPSQLELSGAHEPPKAAFASTSRKVPD